MSTDTKVDWSTPNAELILPVGADQDAWLAARRTGLGGTDAATIMGANHFANRYGTWVDKTSTEPTVDQKSDLLWFGHEVEPMMARRFEAETGIPTRRIGMIRSKTHPFMCANIDRLTGDGGAAEIKSTDWFTDAGKEWTGGDIPAHPWWQMQHCLAVSGRSHGWFLALVGRRFIIAGPIERDESAIAALIEAEREFWEGYVLTGITPPIDFATIDEAEAKARYTVVDPESSIEIEDQPLPQMWHDAVGEFMANRDAESTAKAAKEAAKTQLMTLIANREFLTDSGRPVLRWAKKAGAKYFDADAAVRELAAAHAETEFVVKERLTKKRPDGRVFTVVAAPKQKAVAA